MVIYGLVDPADGRIRYIGQAIRPRARLGRHRRDLSGVTHRQNWIRSVRDAGRTVEMVVIDECQTQAEANQLETHYIALLRTMGFDLTNTTDGGDGVSGYHYSDEQRRAISARLRGRPVSAAALAAFVAYRGTPHSDATKLKISRAKTGTSTGPCSDARREWLARACRQPHPWNAALNKLPWSPARKAAHCAGQRRRWERVRQTKT